jgi:cysteine-rich repeat protein
MSARTRRGEGRSVRAAGLLALARVALAVCMLAVGLLAGCGPGSAGTCDPNATMSGDWVTASAEGSGAPQRLLLYVDDPERVAQVRVRFQSDAPVVLLHRPVGAAYDLTTLLASPLGAPSAGEVKRLSEPMTEGEVAVQGPLREGDLLFTVAVSGQREALSMSAYIRADYVDARGVGLNGGAYCAFPRLRTDLAACGDGQRGGAEACDDGDHDGGDGCAVCKVEPAVCALGDPLRWYPWRCAPTSTLGPDQCTPQPCEGFSDDPLCGAPRAATARAVTFGLQRADADAGAITYVGASSDGALNMACGGVMDSALAAPRRCAWMTSPCAQAERAGALPVRAWATEGQVGACTPTPDNRACAWSDLGNTPLYAAAVFDAPATASRWHHTFSGSAPLWVADPRGGWRLIAAHGGVMTLDGAPLTLAGGSASAPGLVDLAFDADGGLTSATHLPVVGLGVRPLAAAVSADGHLWLALRYEGLTTLPSGASLSAPASGAAPVAVLRLDEVGALRAMYTTDPEQLSVFEAAVLALSPSDAGNAAPPTSVVVVASEGGATGAGAATAALLTPSADGAALDQTWRAALAAPGALVITAAALDDAGGVFLAGAAGGEPTLTTPSLQGPNAPPLVTTLEGGAGRPGGLLLSLSQADGALKWARRYHAAERGLRAATLQWSAPRQLHYLGAFDRADEGLPDAGLALATLDPATAAPLEVTPLEDLAVSCASPTTPALLEGGWVVALDSADPRALAVGRSRCEDSAVVVSALSGAPADGRAAVATEVLGEDTLSELVTATLRGLAAHPAQPGEVSALRANPSASPVGEGWRVDLLELSR